MNPNREDARTFPECGHPRDPEGRQRVCLRCKRYQRPLFPTEAHDLEPASSEGGAQPFPLHEAARCDPPPPSSPGLAKIRDTVVVGIRPVAGAWRRLGAPSVAGALAGVDVFRLVLAPLHHVEVLVPRALSVAERDRAVSALRILALWLETGNAS